MESFFIESFIIESFIIESFIMEGSVDAVVLRNRSVGNADV